MEGYLRTKVSIHTPTQGVTITIRVKHRNHGFQSTHPRRVWQGNGRSTPWRAGVSIHTPTQGVTFDSEWYDADSFVSIHTPTQGVTETLQVVWGNYKVSIHTPTQGVTKHTAFISARNFMFQSTHPRRVWQACVSQSDRRQNVSIHTPTQGVTLYLITYYKSANLIHCYANHHYYSTS